MHKPVLITGASSGIGEAAAVFLARKSFRVYAAARSVEKLEALSGLGGGLITPLALDVTDEGSIERALSEIRASGDTLFGLVNNAGVSVTGPAEEVPLNEWRRQFETNFFALVAMSAPVIAMMREAGGGRIVNIGSVAGRIAAPFFGPYAASKHAVEGVSDAMRRELKPHNIKVSVVRPGFINTAFGDQEQESLDHYIGDGKPYTRQVEIFKTWHAKGHPNAKPPEVVAEKICHALTAERPHSRYTAPASYLGFLAMRNLLPSSLVDRVFERVIGLNNL
ncbi:MAG: SDR family oxidoreductase [Pseudomonadota bacterium]